MVVCVIAAALGCGTCAYAAADLARPAPAAKTRKPKKTDVRRYAAFKQPSETLVKLHEAVHRVLAERPDANYTNLWSDWISGGKDSWGKWDPKGREELFSFIESNRIAGVLLCSGDRHGARVLTIPRSGGFKYYEFEPGSLGKMGGPETYGKDKSNQPFGISNVYAFGEFAFDMTGADPTVTGRIIDEDGKVPFEIKLTRSQLTPGGVKGK